MNNNVRPVTALIYPRGTCKAQTFYFRGDDIHREPEFLDKELRCAKLEYEKLKADLKAEKKEYERVSNELAKREGYTVTLASALGNENHQTEENAKLRQEIIELNKELDEIDAAIAEARSQQHPGLLAQLQKEKAFYNAEIEDLRIKVFDGIDNIRNGKEEIANLVTSNAFTDANLVKSDRISFQKFYQNMRNEMDKLFADFTTKQSEAARNHQPSIKAEPELQGLCQKRLDALLEKEEAARMEKFAKLRAKLTANILIEQIETMNETLIALGGEPMDVEPLKAQYMPQKHEEEEEEEAKVVTRSKKPAPQKTWKAIPKPRPATAFTRTKK